MFKYLGVGMIIGGKVFKDLNMGLETRMTLDARDKIFNPLTAVSRLIGLTHSVDVVRLINFAVKGIDFVQYHTFVAII